MRRRNFVIFLGGTAMILPLYALAQSPGRVYRIGLLNSGASQGGPFEAPLLRGLARHGYIPEVNLTIEQRGAEGHGDRLPRLVGELVESKIDIIIALGYLPALAAKQAPLPVVVFSAGDPVATGLVDSLAHPGGHLTGISDVSAEVTPKRIELLKIIAPSLRRVAMLWNANDLAMTLRYVASEAGAKALGVSVQPLGIREPDDFDHAFAAMNQDSPDAILMVCDPLTILNRKRVFEFSGAHRLPAIYEYDFITRDGGLMSYGLDLEECFDRVGALVDRILKGTKPADLPCKQPTRFKFSLNLNVAKSIGLQIPNLLLTRADELIEQ